MRTGPRKPRNRGVARASSRFESSSLLRTLFSADTGSAGASGAKHQPRPARRDLDWRRCPSKFMPAILLRMAADSDTDNGRRLSGYALGVRRVGRKSLLTGKGGGDV